MHIIVGLGNPGAKYHHTRHNVGFDIVSILSEKLSIPLTKKACKALVGEGMYQGKRIVLAQPQTFMNLSGESVVALWNWYKPETGGLLVAYDDIDLPLGKVRVRSSGSAGTHNGMRSIIGLWGREDFPRIRVGIGPKPEGMDLANFVLMPYIDTEQRKVQFDGLMRGAEAALAWADKDIEAAMRGYNG